MKNILAACLSGLAIACASAQAPPDHGFNFITIGDVGNPDADPATYPIPGFGPASGGVDYEYRIAKSKTNAGQWVEFVNAYYPYHNIPNDPLRIQLLGFNVGVTNPDAGPGEDPGAFIRRGGADWATTGSWNAAARFANWLHNGKVSEPWAFETGAYDFTQSDFPARSADAKFWIPSLDEWNKAVYWDPDHSGEGAGGYWMYPNSSDAPLVPGLPGVGETPALDFPQGTALGQYPDVQTPWGLEDVSGVEYELAEFRESFDSLYLMASSTNGYYQQLDLLGQFQSNPSSLRYVTSFRIASAIPSPGAAALLSVSIVILQRNRIYVA